MGVEQDLMDHLALVLDWHEGYVPATPKPSPLYTAVPPDFGGGTPNHKMLRMACLYLDAVLLQPLAYSVPDTHVRVRQAFTNQFNGGHCVFGNANEVLTPSHGQLWWAAIGAILLGANIMNPDDSPVRGDAVKWFRAEAALCHLCGWKSGTTYRVVAPGARGGEGSIHSNQTRDWGYQYLITGATTFSRSNLTDWRGRYYLGMRTLVMAQEKNSATLQDLRGGTAALKGANNELRWSTADMPKLKDAFKVERNGNEHIASFQVLRALEPQWVARVQGGADSYIFWTAANPELKNGGACPQPIPTMGVPPFTWPGQP